LRRCGGRRRRRLIWCWRRGKSWKGVRVAGGRRHADVRELCLRGLRRGFRDAALDGIVPEAAFEHLAGAEDAGFDGAFLDAEDAGGFFVGEFGDDDHDEGFAVEVGELEHGVADVVVDHDVEDGHEAGGVHGEVGAFCLGEDVGGELFVVAAAGLDVAGGVDVDGAEDGEEPGLAVGAELVLVDGAEGAEVGFLDEVFGAGFVADHAAGDGVDEIHEGERFGFEEAAFFFAGGLGGGFGGGVGGNGGRGGGVGGHRGRRVGGVGSHCSHPAEVRHALLSSHYGQGGRLDCHALGAPRRCTIKGWEGHAS
jgi:hypothetical protein